MIGVILLAFIIIYISSLLPKKIGDPVEVILVVGVIFFLFYSVSFSEATIVYTGGAVAYVILSTMYNRDKRTQLTKLTSDLQTAEAVLIPQEKQPIRLCADVVLTLSVAAGAVMFYLFAPDTYSLLKLIVLMWLIKVGLQTIERVGNFFTTKIYYIEEEERLIFLSLFQSRDFPVRDVKEVSHHSAPDLLRLHPLFTFISANEDYTLSFHDVIKLSFPGEHIFLTVDEFEKWYTIFQSFVTKDEQEFTDKRTEVLPLWHPENMKRLFWKGYFAVTVKGISAYTGLLVGLIFLNVPAFVIVIFVFGWWLVNLYVSDRVLVASTDAVEVTEGNLYDRAQAILRRAGIERTKLYVIDSPIHNGLATGMNIGRGTIMVTTATTELSDEAVDAILAHEAIHIKKRDVLVNQIARMLFFGFLALLVHLFYEQVLLLADNLFLFIPVIYVLMILFPLYLSFVAQWTEVRADYLGAQLLLGGHEQMSSGLRELGEAIDEAHFKTRKYNMNEEKSDYVPSDQRPIWLFRALEFQMMPHPPLYFRIKNVLLEAGWGQSRWNWMKMRVRESIPFLK